MSNLVEINNENISNKIYTIRGLAVMLDRDLAVLYGVETRALKQAVKRNIDRFPNDFMFELSDEEMNFLVSQSVIPSKKSFGGAIPFVFTEQGVSSLSAVLSSKVAVEIHIKIYTQSISKQLRLDYQKYQAQYKNIELKEFKNAHDRFMVIDNKDVYHIGASLKDLGNKWFAFSKFEINALEILGRLKQ